MCLPNKRQRDNFAETGTDKKAAPVASAPATQSSSSPPTTQTQTADNMSAPKVAIVIYSMYGHVAKRTFLLPLYDVCPILT